MQRGFEGQDPDFDDSLHSVLPLLRCSKLEVVLPLQRHTQSVSPIPDSLVVLAMEF